MTQPVLIVHEVRKRYGTTVALDGVELAVNAGELFGLLGPNGAGKTTLLSILSALTDADSGEVTLFGERFHSTNREQRRLIGLATQDLAIYPELTARENLCFFGKLYGLGTVKLRDRVEELLSAVGLADRADHRAGTFSGGMKRRLNLAVAVIHEPRILFLDEPTTGVDPQSRNHIFDRVKALNEAGLTVIYTSHYMEEVQTLCPRIAILDQGRVVACDTLANLLSRFDSTADLSLASVNEELVSAMARIPNVKQCERIERGVRVTATHLAPILPKLLTVCSEQGRDLTAIELNQPTLERVFLHLTGRQLRD